MYPSTSLFNRYRAFRRAWIVRRMLCVICCSLIKICRHSAICGDICSILRLYKGDRGATRAQTGVIFGYLELSWHAQRQTLNLELNTFNPKLSPIAAFAYRTNVFAMVLKLQRSSDIEITCIAEMQKSLSPYACAAKSLFNCVKP